MKRIGILTFHRSTNNGAFIQAYSLSRRLEKDFPQCEVEVIDYSMPKVDAALYPETFGQYFAGGRSLKRKAHLAIDLLRDPQKLSRQREKNAGFAEARKQLCLSDRHIYSDGVTELFEYIRDRYDAVIAGSDAIWNYSLRGFPNPYFLDETITAPKLSYAASCFGMNYENIPDSERKKIKSILSSYVFLGVRDCESEAFAKGLGTGALTCHTCDPTVFLNTDELPVDEDTLTAKLSTAGFNLQKPTVGVMGDDAMCRMARRVCGDDYQITALFNYCPSADVNLYNLNPFEWAKIFKYFRLTFTTYFHGTLLSLRNLTPVICIALDTPYTRSHVSKVEDFLTRVDMAGNYFKNDGSAETLSGIEARAQELLADPAKDFIASRMDSEAETYNIFKNKLAEIIKEN